MNINQRTQRGVATLPWAAVVTVMSLLVAAGAAAQIPATEGIPEIIQTPSSLLTSVGGAGECGVIITDYRGDLIRLGDCDDDDAAVCEAATFYTDADGHGRGDADEALEAWAVDPPDGYVLDNGDLCPQDPADSCVFEDDPVLQDL